MSCNPNTSSAGANFGDRVIKISDVVRARWGGRNEMFVDAAAAILRAPINVDDKAKILSQVAIAFVQGRKRRTLELEMKEAERALGENPNERNFAWLEDVKRHLAALERLGIPAGTSARRPVHIRNRERQLECPARRTPFQPPIRPSATTASTPPPAINFAG
jgi:hypothetical protein